MYSTYKKLGPMVKNKRKIKRYSTKEFANILGVSAGLINTIENNKRDVFKLNLLSNIIETLQIKPDEILKENPLYKQLDFSNKNNEIKIVLTEEGLQYKESFVNFITIISKEFMDFIILYEDKEKISKFTTEYFLQQFNSLNKMAKLYDK